MHRTFVLLVLAVPFWAACGSRTGYSDAAPPTRAQFRPAFPEASGSAPAPHIERQASATDFTLTGNQAWQQSPQGASYSPALAPTALVLTPAQGSTGLGPAVQKSAWAVYRFDGMLDERPLTLATDVAAAGPADGAPPVALSYFVGVSDHTQRRWQWHGPFPMDASFELNSTQLRQRMIDGAGRFFLSVAVDSRSVPATPQNPEGRVAVQLSSITVTGSASTTPTKPLFLEPAAVRIGASLRWPSAVRLPSALQPAQFPVVDWILASEPGPHLASQATLVRVYRHGPTDAAAVLVAQLSAGAGTFRDPLDLDPGIDSAAGGTTYRYSLQAVNAAGEAGVAEAPWVTVPLLAPQAVQASQNTPGGASTQVAWQASDGALSYHVRRGTLADGTNAVEIAEVQAPTTSYADTTAMPGMLYWYFIWADGTGDGNAANGIEAGSISVDSSPAQGLRAVVLTLGTSAPGAGTPSSPYLLTSGQDYQFLAVDQQGTDRTNLCSYAVEPPAAASFEGVPGLLSGIQPGAGDYTVTATLSFQGFTWTTTVYCRTS